MSEVDRREELRERNIIPSERNLETPPAGSEGEIREVTFDRVDERYAFARGKECQACCDIVPLDEPHVWMHGWQENAIGAVHFRAVFCDRDCWTAWASRSN